jgi:Transposase DDE domain group 1
VASPPTMWRVLDEATPAALKRAEKARARIRRHVWDLLPAVPASKVAGTDLGEVVVLDADATLVTAHSEKDQARATFKGGYGFHPLGAWCDNTHEMLAATLRPGNAGSNHAGDHIEVLTHAIAQVPAEHRKRVLVRRRRRHPRAAGLAYRLGPAPPLAYRVLGRLPDQEQRCEERHHQAAGGGVDISAGC